MKCKKCGREYEYMGASCPYCSKPDIIINNTDYLKRKEAYEKKQAQKQSAFSVDDGDSVGNVSEKDYNNGGYKEKQPKSEAVKYEEINYLKLAKKAYSYIKNMLSKVSKNNNIESASQAAKDYETEETAKVSDIVKREAFVKKHKKKIIVLSAVFAAAILLVGGIVQLSLRKNYVLYMSYNNKIYNVAGLESDYVCDVASAVFAADEKTFYIPKFPEEIDKSKMKSVIASDNGEYISAVIYDEENTEYQLYLWKADGSECRKISENSYDKRIQYLTDKGKIIYTDMEVLNDEGALGSVWLYVSDMSGKLSMVEQSLRSVGVYTQQQKLICYNKQNSLYIYDYNKMTHEEEISEEAQNLCLESQTDNFFTDLSMDINGAKAANAFIYEEDNMWYYYDLSDKEKIYLSEAKEKKPQFIYEKKAGYAYILASETIWYGQKDSEGKFTFTKTEDLSGSDYIYLENSNSLIYRSKDGELAAISKGKRSSIDTGVVSNTLTLVDNTENAFTYYKENGQYYRTAVSGKAVKMHDMTEPPTNKETYFYKNRLYFYNADGQLYSCNKKGKDLETVGEVERFWLGTKYQ